MKIHWVKSLRKRFRDFENQKRLLATLLVWIEKVAGEEYLLHTNFFGGEKSVDTRDVKSNNKYPTFLALTNESLAAYLGRVNDSLSPKYSKTSEWLPIYVSDDYSLYVKDDPLAQKVLPAQMCLTNEDKQIALAIVRKAMDVYIEKEQTISRQDIDATLRDVFFKEAVVDVTVWSALGRLRASKLSPKKNLINALIYAAVAATHDSRYKPIDNNELGTSRIEVFVLSDYMRPLNPGNFLAAEVDSTKGYHVSGSMKMGWYLPTVFNAERYLDSLDFYTKFLVRKVGISRAEHAQTQLSNFEVCNFIESSDLSEMLTLRGPLVGQNCHDAPAAALRTRCDAAANWMVRIQENDGYIPSIIDPLTGSTSHSWPRLAAGALHMAHYGAAINEQKYLDVAIRINEYIKNNLHILKSFSNENFLTRVYAFQSGLFVGDSEITENFETLILNDYTQFGESQLVGNTIPRLQLANIFLFSDSVREHSLYTQGEAIVHDIYTRFVTHIERRESLSLAEFAELISISYQLGKTDLIWNQRHIEITDWYLKLQRADGSFPNYSGDRASRAYTRGTGKISEALSINPDLSESALDALRWTLNMQYTKENMHFVPKSHREKIRGGIRHDAQNYCTWTDSAGHALMSASRLHEHSAL